MTPEANGAFAEQYVTALCGVSRLWGRLLYKAAIKRALLSVERFYLNASPYGKFPSLTSK